MAKNLQNLQKNTQLLGTLLQAMQADHLSREDFTKAFKSLFENIQRVREALKEETNKTVDSALARVDSKTSEALDRLDRETTKLESDYKAFVAEMKSDARTTLRMVEQRMAELSNDMPEEYDDEEMKQAIDKLRADFNALEIPKEFDATELTEQVDTNTKDIEELKSRPVGKGGGGVTNMRIAQAFKTILKTEQPVGDIDGANLTYTVSQPIFAILAMSLNGEVIAQLPNYTINGNTFTLSEALPSAYSGKDWEVKYI